MNEPLHALLPSCPHAFNRYLHISIPPTPNPFLQQEEGVGGRRQRRVSVVRYLLVEARIDPNIKDDKGCKPLDIAVAFAQVEVIKNILENVAHSNDFYLLNSFLEFARACKQNKVISFFTEMLYKQFTDACIAMTDESLRQVKPIEDIIQKATHLTSTYCRIALEYVSDNKIYDAEFIFMHCKYTLEIDQLIRPLLIRINGIDIIKLLDDRKIQLESVMDKINRKRPIDKIEEEDNPAANKFPRLYETQSSNTPTNNQANPTNQQDNNNNKPPGGSI